MKTLKALTIAATMTLTAGSALAMGCSGAKHDQQAQSCATGSAWDTATQSCQPVANT